MCSLVAAAKEEKAVTRKRSRKVTSVLLPDVPEIVPKSSRCKRLSKEGRIQKLEFRRSVSSLQTRNTNIKSLAALKPSDFKFLQCTSNNQMCLADNQKIVGDGVITLAGQVSLYMCEDVKVPCVYSCGNS